MASRNATFHGGVWVAVLWSPFRLVFTLALSTLGVILLAWTIDGLFVFKIWPQGIERLRDNLDRDLRNGIALAAQQGSGATVITDPANFLYRVIYETSGIDSMGRQFAHSTALSIPDTVVRRAYVAHRKAVAVTMLGTQLIGVRIATFVRYMPLLILLYVTGAIDGLSERAIRKSGAGCESANLYHRAKYFLVVVAGLGGTSIASWPGSIQWGGCAGLISLSICSLARIQWTYYKKHL